MQIEDFRESALLADLRENLARAERAEDLTLARVQVARELEREDLPVGRPSYGARRALARQASRLEAFQRRSDLVAEYAERDADNAVSEAHGERVAAERAERERKAQAKFEKAERKRLDRRIRLKVPMSGPRMAQAEADAYLRRHPDLWRAHVGFSALVRSMAHRWFADGTTYCGADVAHVEPVRVPEVRERAIARGWTCPDCLALAGGDDPNPGTDYSRLFAGEAGFIR